MRYVNNGTNVLAFSLISCKDLHNENAILQNRFNLAAKDGPLDQLVHTQTAHVTLPSMGHLQRVSFGDLPMPIDTDLPTTFSSFFQTSVSSPTSTITMPSPVDLFQSSPIFDFSQRRSSSGSDGGFGFGLGGFSTNPNTSLAASPMQFDTSIFQARSAASELSYVHSSSNLVPSSPPMKRTRMDETAPLEATNSSPIALPHLSQVALSTMSNQSFQAFPQFYPIQTSNFQVGVLPDDQMSPRRKQSGPSSFIPTALLTGSPLREQVRKKRIETNIYETTPSGGKTTAALQEALKQGPRPLAVAQKKQRPPSNGSKVPFPVTTQLSNLLPNASTSALPINMTYQQMNNVTHSVLSYIHNQCTTVIGTPSDNHTFEVEFMARQRVPSEIYAYKLAKLAVKIAILPSQTKYANTVPSMDEKSDEPTIFFKEQPAFAWEVESDSLMLPSSNVIAYNNTYRSIFMSAVIGIMRLILEPDTAEHVNHDATTIHMAALNKQLMVLISGALNLPPPRSAGLPTNIDVEAILAEEDDVDIANLRTETGELDKKLLKRLRNRVSATRCRNKRRLWARAMGEAAQNLGSLTGDLRSYIEMLEAQKEYLIGALDEVPGVFIE